MPEELVSLAQYAELHGISKSAVKQKVASGGYKTARKVGATYVIDANEPHVDRRIKHGKRIKKDKETTR